MELKLSDKVKLNNGVEMPMFGLGVYLTKQGKETQSAVKHALTVGYRLIDTASMYGNEKDVGTAIKESGVPREEIFVTTKLWNDDHGYDKALKAFEKSLKKLDIGYIDLYLIHWPAGNKRNDTWKAFEKIIETGKCRAIGISNYMINHIKELLSFAEVVPAVNQVEFSPYLYQKDLLEYCNSNKIQLEAYSPLARGRKLDDPTLNAVSNKYSKTPAQIMLRWALQHKVVVIPKSSNNNRIEENADIFDFNLDDEDMQILDSSNYNFRVAWDPSRIA